jgi:hypothetical protein
VPFQKIAQTPEQYALLSYDKNGRERTDDPDGIGGLLSKAIAKRVAEEQPTHVFLFSHGWKGDIDAARDQYNRWIKAMLDRTADRARMPDAFKPLWIGLHWPSLPFGDEEIAGDSFDASGGLSPEDIVKTYTDRLNLNPDAIAPLRKIVDAHWKNAAAKELPPDVAQAYNDLAAKIGYQSAGPSGPPDAEGAPFDPQQAFDRGTDASNGANFAGGGLVDGILGPLRQFSYWTMKKRARAIGESGMHDFVALLMNEAPEARFHLMGHSFGTIVVAGILGGPNARAPLPRKVDSAALIQGAVSLWAFGDSVHYSKSKSGYFNPWINQKAVRGPLIVSTSVFDKAVGVLYPWASAVSFNDGAFDVLEVDPPDLPLYGAIGKFGIRGLAGAENRPMLDENSDYNFQAGHVYNLEASKYIKKMDGISGAHSDIDGPQVAHALWQAALI